MSELVTAPASAAAVAAALAHGGGFVETGVEASPALVEAVAGGALGVALTTAQAYRLPLASLLRAAALRHFGITYDSRLALEVSLQEALANAIVHGNLTIGATEGLDERFARIEAGLADPVRSALRVEATLALLADGS
ncbi:MAG: hypothetical protein ACM31L_07650, partial [Actinomycetota bacterium]